MNQQLILVERSTCPSGDVISTLWYDKVLCQYVLLSRLDTMTHDVHLRLPKGIDEATAIATFRKECASQELHEVFKAVVRWENA